MNKFGRKIAGLVLAAGVALSVFAGTSLDAYAYTQTTGKVTSDNVKVRESASTTAKQVSSLKNGDSVDIVDESKDASGYVWYKIYVNKNEFGYVRSDLISKAGGSSSSSGTTSNSSAASLPETAVTAVEQKSATVITDSVNVRSGAGTSYDSVGKVTKGDTVTITGEATGTDNKTWYKVTFGANSKEGFVRSDLVEISEAVAAEVTEGGEAPAEGGENAEVAEGGEATEEVSEESQQPEVSQDQGDGKYSLKYIAGDDGNSVWYLYDNEGGYRVVVDELIAAAQSAEAVNKLRKQVGTFKKVAIALGVLAVVLLAAVLFLVLKLRDSLYYEEEEEEEYDRYDNRRKFDNSSARRPSRDEDEEESERPVRRTADRDREVRPVRRENRDASEARPTRRSVEERTVRPSRRDPEDDMDARPSRRAERNEDEDVERPSRRSMRDADDRPSRRASEDRQSASAKEEAPKRRARNFIGDDDDFEFEFLDLDD